MKEEIRRAIEHLSEFDKKHAAESIEAAKALGALGVEALCAVLDAPEALSVPGGRRNLSAQMACQDPAAVTPALLKALANKDWRPVQVACDAIGKIGESMIPLLIDNVEKEKTLEGRVNTIMILRRMGAVAAVGALGRLAVEDPEADVRVAAVETLGRLGVEGSNAAIVAAVRDQSELVKFKAVKAAGWIKIREATDGILEFAREANPDGRAAAVYALDRIGDTCATPLVVEFLKDPDPYVRWSAAVALRRLWKQGCETALKEALQDSEETVASAARETLDTKRGPSGPA